MNRQRTPPTRKPSTPTSKRKHVAFRTKRGVVTFNATPRRPPRKQP